MRSLVQEQANPDFVPPTRPDGTPFDTPFAPLGNLSPEARQEGLRSGSMRASPFVESLRTSGVPQPFIEFLKVAPSAQGINTVLDYVGKAGAAAANPKENNITALTMAQRAAGLETGDPRVDRLNPHEAQRVFQYYSPPITAQVPGGTVFAPRGKVTGFVPNPTAVPPKVLEDIETKTASLERMRRLSTGFSDKFVGFKSNVVGDAVVEYNKRFGENTEMADWWQQYQEHVNAVRKELFGSALTDTERKAFEKAMVMPGMKPDLARKNLERQEVLSRKAARKLLRSTAANQGFNQDQIREAAGGLAAELLNNNPESIPEIPKAPVQGSVPKKRIKFEDL